jgi:hypothetical protein
MAVIPGTASSYSHNPQGPEQLAPAPAIEGVPDTSGPSPVQRGTIGTYDTDATLTADAESKERPGHPVSPEPPGGNGR